MFASLNVANFKEPRTLRIRSNTSNYSSATLFFVIQVYCVGIQIGLLFSYISCGKPVKDAMKWDPHRPRMSPPPTVTLNPSGGFPFDISTYEQNSHGKVHIPHITIEITKFVLNFICRYITLPLGTHIFTTASFLASIQLYSTSFNIPSFRSKCTVTLLGQPGNGTQLLFLLQGWRGRMKWTHTKQACHWRSFNSYCKNDKDHGERNWRACSTQEVADAYYSKDDKHYGGINGRA